MGQSLIYIETIKRNLLKREEEKIKENENYRLKLLEKIKMINIWEKYSNIKNVYVFGSILKRGYFNRKSDIDVIIEGNLSKDYFILWKEIEDNIDWKVDLREIKNETPLAKKVRTEGIKIYERKNIIT